MRFGKFLAFSAVSLPLFASVDAVASLSAAQFWNQYRHQPSAIPLPACAQSSPIAISEIQQLLLEHNRARKDADIYVTSGVPLPAISWNCGAAQVAQAWANQSKGSLGHSTPEWRKTMYSRITGVQGRAANLGENLAWAGGSDFTVVPDLVKGVKDWDAERSLYNARTKSCRGVCGHYTQMVWRETTSIGCGITRDRIRFPNQSKTWPKGYFLACHYHLAGNINGDSPFIHHPAWYYQ